MSTGKSAHTDKKLVILDRDGVINEDSDAYIKSPAEWRPIEGSLQAIARLNRAGFKVYVATNQSGLTRGLFTIETLNRIHQKMLDMLQHHGGNVVAILFCPHAPDDDCACRKPKPGLYLDIAERNNISLQGIPVIGDSFRDIEAAKAVNARPILVRTGNGSKTEQQHADALQDIEIYDDLASTVDTLINEYGSQA
ncbi:MAG: D-glycero-beta-D-manno-heptose 1,7-bisphosphate 7-phosphatase [Candidatus Thiodiazotropha sp.]